MCEDCKLFANCEIVKQIKEWEKEQDLQVEYMLVSWVFRDMCCKQFSEEEH